MAANADVQVGDVLTTSGVDGVYPPGLPVAKVVPVERRADPALRASCWRRRIGRRRAPRAGAGADGRADAAARRSRRRPPRQAAQAARRPRRCGAGRSRACQPDAGGRAMIMPRGSDQLLLPVNPFFIGADAAAGAAASTCCRWAGTPAQPDLLALVLVFWNVHQPRRVGVGLAFVLRPADGRAPGRAARPACAGLHAAELLCAISDAPAAAVVQRCRAGGAGAAAVRWPRTLVSLVVRMVGRRHVPGLATAAGAAVRGAAVAGGQRGCCWRRSAARPIRTRIGRCERR